MVCGKMSTGQNLLCLIIIIFFFSLLFSIVFLSFHLWGLKFFYVFIFMFFLSIFSISVVFSLGFFLTISISVYVCVTCFVFFYFFLPTTSLFLCQKLLQDISFARNHYRIFCQII